MKYLIIVLIAYLLGSFCASIPLSKRVYGGDVREKGSGNAGATNMARVYGMKAGLATFALDALKTVAAMLAGLHLGGAVGEALAGAACIFGHCFPVYFAFRGGKGVLCTGTLVILMNWKIACIAFALFLLVFFLTRYVSLGSFVGVISSAVMLILQYRNNPWVCALMGVMVVLVLFMHRDNIKRLLHGQERKTYFHKEKNEREAN